MPVDSLIKKTFVVDPGFGLFQSLPVPGSGKVPEKFDVVGGLNCGWFPYRKNVCFRSRIQRLEELVAKEEWI